MNVIIAYLDTMFSAYPRTPRLVEAKAELQAMMEDAYTGLIAEGRSHNEAVGQVITDFGNLDELAPVLGISGEIAAGNPGSATPLAANASTAATTTASTSSDPGVAATPTAHRPITLDEAKRYAEARRRLQPRLAIAIALFVLAPAAMFLVIGLGERIGTPFSEDSAGAIGLVPLLVLVAAGVMVILSRERGLTEFRHLARGEFTGNPAVAEWARGIEQQQERRRLTSLPIAVGLWILSAVPLLLSALIFSGPGSGTLGLAATLAIVAAGLLVLLPTTWASDVARELGKAGASGRPGAAGRNEEGSVIGVIAAIYWPLLTAIFLAWSFIGDAWDRSWMVWPIGAVLFGAIAAGSGAWSQYRKNRG